jgi:uncharacterized 2Fe-2S/4Fe-4S cluster protein (DUF4445 family)
MRQNNREKSTLDKEKFSILFQPSGRRGEVEAGQTLLQAAQELGVPLEAPCGGKNTCGKCKVRVDRLTPGCGNSPESLLSPFSAEEETFITEGEKKAGYRLACMTRVYGDVLVFIPEESRGVQQVIRKEAREIAVELNPAIKACYAELPPPTLHEPTADFERLLRVLDQSFGLRNLTIDLQTLRLLPQQLREADWKATAMVWMDREIVDLQPGKVEDYYGAAVDIGTTTVAVYLCNLRTGRVVSAGSMMNPQVAYGEDVMSRITYVMVNPQEGLGRLQEAILNGLNGLLQEAAQAAQISPRAILEMTVVGNTAMHHLFLGIDPHPLGLSPFAPATHHSQNIKARDLGLEIHPAAYVHVLPIEAGFVGADNVGVLISETPYQKDEMTLTIDIGTNGELVLGNREKLLSSSCATGPALEGAHLRFGMRAAPGAIERVRIDPETLEVRYRVIGQEKWSDELNPEEIQARGICGSGIIEVVAEMFRTGVVGKSGRFNGNLSTPRLRRIEKGFEFVIAWARETAMEQDITVSTSDVRAVQLAKGALYSGAKIMMKRLGMNHLDRIVLAGGFGSYVDPERAMILGMFPDCDLKHVVSVGNAAGDGARIALLNRDKREEADRIARDVEYIELSVDPEFSMEFAEAMAFPHLKDSFPHLEGILKTGRME